MDALGDLRAEVAQPAQPMEPDERRYFFLHVMKTGGATFESYVRQNFSSEQIYGLDNRVPDIARQRNYVNIGQLLLHTRHGSQPTRFLRGHFPFVATQLVGWRLTTMTILREPVDRTISYLQHCQRHHPEHASLRLEQIYEDEWFFSKFVHNYQLKMFAMTPAEALAVPSAEHADTRAGAEGTARALYEAYGPTLTELVTVDDARVKVATENLGNVDVVGFTDRYDEFLRELESKYGWRIKRARHRNTGEQIDAAPAFRRRIAGDQVAEIEFYESARRLVRE